MKDECAPNLQNLTLGPELEGLDGALDYVVTFLLDQVIGTTVLKLGGDELVCSDALNGRETSGGHAEVRWMGRC